MNTEFGQKRIDKSLPRRIKLPDTFGAVFSPADGVVEQFGRSPGLECANSTEFILDSDQDIVAHERARHVELLLGYL